MHEVGLFARELRHEERAVGNDRLPAGALERTFHARQKHIEEIGIRKHSVSVEPLGVCIVAR